MSEPKRRDPFARMRARDAARKAAKERESNDGPNNTKIMQMRAEEVVKDATQKVEALLTDCELDCATAKILLADLRSALREHGSIVGAQLGRRARTVADALSERLQENSFHFSADIRTVPADEVAARSAVESVRTVEGNECVDGYSCSGFEHKKDETLVLEASNDAGSGRNDVVMNDLQSCTVAAKGLYTAVRMLCVCEGIVLVSGVKGTVYMEDCVGLTAVLGAYHQLRIHRCRNCRIVICSGLSAPIIEDCSEMVFSRAHLPYSHEDLAFSVSEEDVKIAGIDYTESDDSTVSRVHDFNWQRQGDSPNWRWE